MHERVVVAVHIEHQIGVHRLSGQGLAQGVQLRARPHLGDHLDQGGADRRHVGRFRIGQLARDLLGGGGEQVGPVAIEVAAAAQLMAAQVGGVDLLVQTDRVGEGRDHDLAPNRALGLGRHQAPHQVVRGQQRGDLVGVDRGLEVGLGPGAGFAEAVQHDLAPGARRAGAERPAFDTMRHGGFGLPGDSFQRFLRHH